MWYMDTSLEYPDQVFGKLEFGSGWIMLDGVVSLGLSKFQTIHRFCSLSQPQTDILNWNSRY